MKAKRFEDFESGLNELFNTADNATFTTKLERRRRIEELEEEKRLKDEMCELV